MKKTIKLFALLLIISLIIGAVPIYAGLELLPRFMIGKNDLNYDKMIILIDAEHSDNEKVWGPEDFPDIEILEIQTVSNSADYMNFESFTQVLYVTLKTDDEESLFGAFEKLEKYNFVFSAKTSSYSPYPSYIIESGDVNYDGEINSVDYILVKRFVIGNYYIQGGRIFFADVNNDYKINAVDYLLMKKYITGQDIDLHLYDNYGYHIVRKDGVYSPWEYTVPQE